jgi:nucleotide-binding universal stress UspA family protein
MFAPILVATDFSAPSEAALAYGRRLAESTGARLHVLHVVDNLFMRAVLGDPRDYETAALRQMQDRMPAQAGGPAAIMAVERSDEPADEIISYARVHGIELIVMGTHGRGRMAHLLLGSVAEKIARTAPCPVLTLREMAPSSGANGLRILVPTDFSPCSDAALDYAKRMAARLRGSIRLLHILEHSAVAPSPGSEMFMPEPPQMRQERVATAQSQLSRRVLADSPSRVEVTTDVLFGPTGAMITAYAGDNGFDVIIMGTHGRTGLAHLLMGSVAESVIRTAPCPVLTVKSVHADKTQPATTEPASAAV